VAASSRKVGRVVLIGFMGAGKSTVARILAARLGWACVDLDQQLAEREGKTLAQIFSDHGEGHFRQLEADALTELLRAESGPHVLATGGGLVESEASRAALLAATDTRVFYLEAPLDVLVERCRSQEMAAERPLLADSEQRFAGRAPLYAAVGVPVSTVGLTPEEVASYIQQLLQIDQQAG
jgi:shikimate kinase